jgi:glycosyltransferase involved in cell wall biosynthesis
MAIPLNLVANSLSFGQVSTSILRELYNRKEEVFLSVISNQIDLSAQEKDEDFERWIDLSRSQFLKYHSRDNRIFKLWHLNGGLDSFSKEQVLFSFYELDEPTEEEVNIVKNNYKVLFSCEEAVEHFKKAGCDNVYYVPLGFDDFNFSNLDKEFYDDDRIVFSLLGKFESRKNHARIIKAWLKKFGNNKKYSLHCALWNPFLSPEENNSVIALALEGKTYYNTVFTGFMQSNKQYNEFLNASHVVIAMSGGEGWGLPEFQSVALGKHAVVLDASGYRGWANEENSVLVKPSGKKPVYDEKFFFKGAPFNQGELYDFNEHAFIAACEEVIKRVEGSRVNEAGKKLKEKFTYSKTVDSILEHLK